VSQFRCCNCNKNSRYLKRKSELLLEFKVPRLPNSDETRTYECEHCSAENQVTMPANDWLVIDLSARAS
jgi:hypothetical protein